MIEGNEKSANLPGLPECEEDQSACTAGNSPSSRVERPDNQADDLLCFATPQANHVDEEQGGSSKYALTTSEQEPISFGEDAQGEWQHRQESNSAIDLRAKVRSGVRSIQRAGQRLLGGLIFGRNTWTDDSLPVPQIEPDILEEDVFDAFKVNPYTEDCRSQGWKCIGVSAIGSNHIIRQEPCQDAYATRRLPDGTLLIAMADGAGSAEYSADGAHTAVQAAVDHLEALLTRTVPVDERRWEQMMIRLFQEAQLAVSDAAFRAQRPLREYATTLLVVVASDEWIVSGMVGDGALVVVDSTDALRCLTTPQRGEYANATYFITGRTMLEHLAVNVSREQIKGLAVLTDGLLNLSVSDFDNEPFRVFFEPLFKFLDASTDEQRATDSLARFLTSDRVNRRTHDDKSLVLALRNQKAEITEVSICDSKPVQVAG